MYGEKDCKNNKFIDNLCQSWTSSSLVFPTDVPTLQEYGQYASWKKEVLMYVNAAKFLNKNLGTEAITGIYFHRVVANIKLAALASFETRQRHCHLSTSLFIIKFYRRCLSYQS